MGKLKLKYLKSTRNTHVYVDDSDGAPVPTLYIKKDTLSGDHKRDLIVVISHEGDSDD